MKRHLLKPTPDAAVTFCGSALHPQRHNATIHATEVSCLRCLQVAAVKHEAEAVNARNKLADLRASIETSIANAEDMTYYGESPRGYKIKAVSAKELRGILDGRIG